jgi:hypothetical protein
MFTHPINPKSIVVLLFGLCGLFCLVAPASGQTTGGPNPLLGHRISFEEAVRLVAGNDEGNLARQADRFTRTRLRSGQIVEIHYPLTVNGRPSRKSVPGYGMLYPSVAAYQEATRPRHMLEDLIPDGRKFIEQIPELIGRLEKRLRLTPGRLQFSRVGLRRIDGYLRHHHASHTTAQTDPRLFQELTAFYGETLRRGQNGHQNGHQNGQWKIREEIVGGTHRQTEPNIVTASGQELKPWSSVIRALYDEDNRGFGLTRSFDQEWSKEKG